MLKTKLLHPDILQAIASAGHGSKILIADGNYPFATGSNPAARRVFLNVALGLVSVTDVLEAVGSAIAIEAAQVMQPANIDEPEIFEAFRSYLGSDVPLNKLGRFEFYDEARKGDVTLVVATAEQRLYSNILLTIGVVS